MVEVHEDRVVISNPGGIPAGMDIKDLMQGVSKRRNELIANIFARMHVAERMGSGLKRIARLLKDADQPLPEIDSNLFFKITFKRPPFSESSEEITDDSDKGSDKAPEISQAMVLEAIKDNPKLSAKKLAKLFGITPRAVEKHISNLKAVGLLERIGAKKHGYWKVK